MADIDWTALRVAADTVATNAHAPYSGLKVGAAAVVDDGRLITGCNVENASYGLSICAEVGLVSGLVAGGPGRLLAVSVRTGDRLLMPCGRCRQVLLEHGGAECLVDTAAGPRRLGELLPDAFGPDDL
jgi:cytidine deaminase